MLKINDGQMSVLEDKSRNDFQERMLVHIAKFFPEHDAALDFEQKHALIDHGIERGAEYAIVSERDICIWVDLMLALGPDFDVSETYPWAATILADDLRLPNLRMDELHARVVEEIESRDTP